MVGRQSLEAFLEPLFVLRVFHFHIGRRIVARRLIERLSIYRNHLPLAKEVDAKMLGYAAHQTFGMSSRLNVFLDGPELEHRILCDILSLIAANTITLTDLQGYLPQLRNDMDEFILCNLLSFILFVQNYNINGKEVFFLMGLTYINKKAWL